MTFTCRKCLCSRKNLCEADTYAQLHAKNQVERTNEMLKQDCAEAKTLEGKKGEKKHVRGVAHASLFQDFPFFDIPKQLPQCVSHDYMEGKESAEITSYIYFFFIS
jgi:hypothetical protein